MAKISWEDEKKGELLNILSEQIKTEGQLVGLYEDYVHKTENKAVKKMMHMISLDCRKHIDLIQACIEIIEGEDVFIEDKWNIKDSLKKHLELEAESIKVARKAVDHLFIRENKGLNDLLNIWLDDERKHHKILKNCQRKPISV